MTGDVQVRELPQLLSLDGACAELSIGITLLRQLMANDQIRTVRIGRRVLVPATEIIRLLTDLENNQ